MVPLTFYFAVRGPSLSAKRWASIDLNSNWDEYGVFIDSFANEVLQKTGNLDLVKDPYYQCWKDPVVLKAVDEWKLKL